MLGGFLEKGKEGGGHEEGAHDVGGIRLGPLLNAVGGEGVSRCLFSGVDGRVARHVRRRAEEVIAELFGVGAVDSRLSKGDACVVDEDA